jgi:hypothetical protein
MDLGITTKDCYGRMTVGTRHKNFLLEIKCLVV